MLSGRLYHIQTQIGDNYRLNVLGMGHDLWLVTRPA